MRLVFTAGLCALAIRCVADPSPLQQPAPGLATPPPAVPTSELPPDLARKIAPPKPSAPHEQPRPLLFTGSFEAPVVTAPTPLEQGGNPVMRLGPREWVSFQLHQAPAGGKLNVGLTNAFAHTGKQSLYFDFAKVTAPEVSAEFASDYIPIVPGERYRCVIWGLLDKKRPLTLDQRLPFLRLEVDFLQEDKKNAAGESALKIQPMPGGRTHPLFVAGKWVEFFADIVAPDNAAWLRTAWLVSTPPQSGETDGVIYFDDANVIGPPGKNSGQISAAEREAQIQSAIKAVLKAGQPAVADASATPKPKTPKKAK